MHFPPAAATESGDPIHALAEYDGSTVLGLFPHGDGADIAFGSVTIPVGGEVPLHRNSHPETIYLITGSVRAWRPGSSAEIEAPGAAYFPADVAHAIRNIGSVPATMVVAWATGGDEKVVTSSPAVEDELESDHNPSSMPFGPVIRRWTMTADTAIWEPVESTKGMRLRCKYLLDGASGTPDFVTGLASISPDTHYTIHRHEPAEIYYVLEGHATIHVGDEAYEVGPGDTVYVPAWGPHGIDTRGEQLEMFWFYATDQCNSWTWEPLEPIYTRPPRRPLESGPRRGVHTPHP